jgi:manganese efflux pump family protein
VLALVPAALSPGLPDSAAAIGIGIAGVDARTRVRSGVVSGIFEAGMPVAACPQAQSAGESRY